MRREKMREQQTQFSSSIWQILEMTTTQWPHQQPNTETNFACLCECFCFCYFFFRRFVRSFVLDVHFGTFVCQIGVVVFSRFLSKCKNVNYFKLFTKRKHHKADSLCFLSFSTFFSEICWDDFREMNWNETKFTYIQKLSIWSTGNLFRCRV